MWRSYVICVLIGLLLVSSGVNIVLLRQVLSLQATTDRLQKRVASAESVQNSLQQQVDQLKNATPGAAPSTPAAVPTIGVAGASRTLLQQIQNDVAGLRGLQPKGDVQVQFLDQAALQGFLVDRFNRDYWPSERESDQKLESILGLIGPNESITQTLLDILQEQVIGVYSEDNKVMYIVGDKNQFGPEEQDTFAHEFTHALQDQYFDLSRLAPKHPMNDDRAMAIQALIEGDAVLMQRLWAQTKLSQDEINELGRGAADSKLFSAPLFVRQQLLFPYIDGFSFVRQMYQAGGGYPGVDDVFRNPPDSTEQVLHPDKYRAHEKPVDVSLPDLSQGSLGPGWRSIKSNVLGELDLRLILEQFTDRARAARSASGWGGDRWQLLEKDGQQALVVKTVWDTDNDARNFSTTMGLAFRNRFPTAHEEEASPARQALTATGAATEVRQNGTTVVVVIAFDRPTAEAIATAVGR